jgi:signal transduction histidine kinase
LFGLSARPALRRRSSRRYEKQQATELQRRTRNLYIFSVTAWTAALLSDRYTFGSWKTVAVIRLPPFLGWLCALFYLRRSRARLELERLTALMAVLVCAANAISMFTVLEQVQRIAVSTLLGGSLCFAYVSLRARVAFACQGLLWVTVLVPAALRAARGAEPRFHVLLLVAAALAVSAAVAGAFALQALRAERRHLRDFALRTRLERKTAQLREEAELRRGLFVHLSHDLRIPLTLIRGRAEALIDGEADQARRGALSQIAGNSTQLVDLVEQLLELARLDEGQTPFAPVACAPARVAREVASQLQPANALVRIEVKDESGGRAARADVQQLTRILLNLIANALRFVPEGGGAVVLRVHADGLSKIRVDVSNDGPPIPPERRELVFRRFVVLDGEGATPSGIGLPLARELAELGGGALYVLDAPLTTFRLELPASEEPDAIPEAAPAQRDAAQREPAPRSIRAGALPVLVVDDNPDMRAMLCDVLRPEFEPCPAASLAEAMPWLEQRRPAAIVSDVLLGDGTGYDLLTQVRRQARLANVPLLFLSALADEDERARGLRAGADDYLAKPFSSLELKARLFSAVTRAEARNVELLRQRELFLMELHDGVNACLSRAAILLGAGQPAQDPGRSAAISAIREAADEMRTLLSALDSGPIVLQEFWADLRRDLAETSLQAGLAAEFAVSGELGDTAVGPATAHAVRRIAREATTNTIKHASARKIGFSLDCAAGGITLRVTDDGRGMDATRAGGRGLGIMRRRAERLGGELRLTSGAEHGTVVEALIPLITSDGVRPSSRLLG